MKATFADSCVIRFCRSNMAEMATEATEAAEYSPRHQERVRAEIATTLSAWRLAELIWNACTWAGVDPETFVDGRDAVDLDLADLDRPDDLVEDDDFLALTDARWEPEPVLMAGDVGTLADEMADDDLADLADLWADDDQECTLYVWSDAEDFVG